MPPIETLMAKNVSMDRTSVALQLTSIQLDTNPLFGNCNNCDFKIKLAKCPSQSVYIEDKEKLYCVAIFNEVLVS